MDGESWPVARFSRPACSHKRPWYACASLMMTRAAGPKNENSKPQPKAITVQGAPRFSVTSPSPPLGAHGPLQSDARPQRAPSRIDAWTLRLHRHRGWVVVLAFVGALAFIALGINMHEANRTPCALDYSQRCEANDIESGRFILLGFALTAPFVFFWTLGGGFARTAQYTQTQIRRFGPQLEEAKKWLQARRIQADAFGQLFDRVTFFYDAERPVFVRRSRASALVRYAVVTVVVLVPIALLMLAFLPAEYPSYHRPDVNDSDAPDALRQGVVLVLTLLVASAFAALAVGLRDKKVARSTCRRLEEDIEATYEGLKRVAAATDPLPPAASTGGGGGPGATGPQYRPWTG